MNVSMFDKVNDAPKTKVIKPRSMKEKVTINLVIDMDTYATIVDTIANSCFQEDGYHPSYREMVRRLVILQYFTDIEVNESNMFTVFELSQSGNWFEDIENEVTSLRIWAEIEQAVDKQIDYMIATRTTKFDELCDSIKVFTDTMNDTSALTDIANKLKNIDDKTLIETIVEKTDKQNNKINKSKSKKR